jgi:hypothetical protein
MAGFDGSAPLICSVIEVFECSLEQDCIEGTVESMNIPQFVRIDFAMNKISTTEEIKEKRESPINNFDRADGMLILQGIQNGRGWSMVIAEETGKMTATASGGGGGFVIFGACTLD